ncbi:GntR family transcriptional regulator [Methyloceanibacter sp.]|uniref:GntR family transcriptional regulator n=1 Tax=Methyloceanibacter sp. TaxID=1965321 RepID=UPI002D3F2C22|nr:GntR family transcriptional regulator [Methyloceanibacter sp.]HZP07907.1 GntR family transcriptional regulator [Methyloceanibacter sp.]
MERSDHLDRDSVVPLYFQLQEILKEKIELGLWNAGEALPPEEELCATYDVSRTVVRQALAILEQDRQIIRVRGSGTFVAVPKVEQRAGGFSRLLDSATPGAQITILDARTQTASRRIGAQLNLKSDSDILRVMSLLHIRDVPVALFDSFFPVSDSTELRRILPRAFPSVLTNRPRRTIELTKTEVTIETSFCSKWEAEQLAIPFRGAVFVTLIVEHRAAGHQDRPFEVARAVYRADRVQFHLELSGHSAIPQATWQLSEAN